MGLFNFFRKKKSIDQISKEMIDYVDNRQGKNESTILIRGEEFRDGFEIKEGVISGNMLVLPKTIMEIARNNEFFAKAIITVSEAMKHNDPEYQQFCDKMQKDVAKLESRALGGDLDELKGAIRRKLNISQEDELAIQSINLSDLDSMSEDDFDDMIDKIFKSGKGE